MTTMRNSQLLQNMGVPKDDSEILYDHYCATLKDADWDAVQERISSHPKEASQKDCIHDLFPLDIALNSDLKQKIPLQVYSSLIEANPYNVGESSLSLIKQAFPSPYTVELLQQMLNVGVFIDEQKILEVALTQGNDDAVRVLLDRSPHAVKAKSPKTGRLPLHIACDVGKPEIVELILDLGVKHDVGGQFGAGGIYEKDFNGDTPLGLIIHEMNNPFESEASRNLRTCAATAYLVRGDTHYFPILHTALLISTPAAFEQVLVIAKEFDQDLSGTDHHGRTALVKAIHFKKEHPHSKKLISTLLGWSLKSLACVRDGAGRFPLHIAAEMDLEWNNGLEDIVHANRAALKEPHSVTGLYPFMIAANMSAELESTYFLLKEDPQFNIQGMNK